jgi:hypothetical protein
MRLSNAWRGPQGRFVLHLTTYPIFVQWEGKAANTIERVEPLRCTHIGDWPIDAYYAAMVRGQVPATETTR